MPKLSAGLLVYRLVDGEPEVLLVHPGGPYWAKKDDGAWSIPKGEYEPDEDPLEVALREFEEEIGETPPDPAGAVWLGELRQPSGKIVSAWAVDGDVDVSDVHSNTFEMEWPPRSGRTKEFPEVDRAAWFEVEEARSKLHRGQLGFIDRLLELVEGVQVE
ncbi:MAG: NUDIX domain-containing protein [Actinomycetota bacterium]